MEMSSLRSSNNLIQICIRFAKTNVIGDALIENIGILGNPGDRFSPGFQVDFLERCPIYQQQSFVRLQKAQQQLDQGALP